ncbi:FHA domain-containing protein [Lujinxingia vulgaris]|uniref:FHA domain-containing protein n=1 Tax=Lujinxingia vulgaris TaxID=2600176 RepID=A0A5C6WYB3_9DELT|nr:FHA domain-containing protein [Lujinxingia vulgaris]TXD34472.1 FHA domain-containing protein [Lujinxingia vulgaris]
MHCPVCAREIPTDARFCAYCGSSVRKCEPCQRFYPGDARFCGSCGESLVVERRPTFEPPSEVADTVFGYLYELNANPQQFPLEQGDNTIGAGGNNDIVIRRPAVSWNHAIVICRNERVRIQDSASTNGTYINGKRVRVPHALNHGDLLRFGSEEFKVWLKPRYRTSETV